MDSAAAEDLSELIQMLDNAAPSDMAEIEDEPRVRSKLVPSAEWFTQVSCDEKSCTTRIAYGGMRSLVAGYLADYTDVEPSLSDAVASGMMQFRSSYLRVLVLEANVARVAGTTIGTTSHGRFESFINALSDRRFQTYLFRKYPGLYRWFANQVDRFVRSGHNISRNVLEQDADLRSKKVRTLQFIGDSHVAGQQSAIVQFTDGSRVVVKHRPFEFEAMAQRLVEEVSRELELDLRLAASRRVSDYVVSEFIESSKDELERGPTAYRYGAWLSFFHYLNTSDLHFENFIHSASGPVPVDLECGLSPRLGRLEGPNPSEAIHERISLSRSSILPVADLPGSFAVLWSPLAGAGRDFPGGMHILKDDGSEHVQLDYEPRDDDAEFDLRSNVLSSADDVSRFRQGFADCQLALSRRTQSIRELARACGDFRSRVVRKPTRFYFDVLRRLSHPRYLIDPASLESELDDLLARSGDPREADAHEAEKAALLVGFIPSFHASMNGSSVVSDRGESVWPVEATGAQELEFRMRELDDADTRRFDRNEVANSLAVHVPFDWVLLEPTMRTTGEADAYAHVRTGIWLSPAVGEPRTVSWSNLLEDVPGRPMLGIAELDLYHGKAGLLMTAVQQISDEHEQDTLVDALAADIEANVVEWQDTSKRFGLYTGAAGAVYALAYAASRGRVRRNLVRERVKDVLIAGTDLCDEHELSDVFSGTAGLLLLLARMRAHGLADEWAAGIADRLLHHLARSAVQDERGLTWWPSGNDGEHLGGFAHGVAGIAAATAPWRMHPVAAEVHTAATKSQDSLRVAPGHWRDMRAHMDAEVLDAWCHGASGIILADDQAGDMVAQDDLKQWAAYGEPRDLTLCHGLAGAVIVSTDLTGSASTRTKYLHAPLRTRIATKIQEYSRPSFLLGSNSLFMGTTGIAYALQYVKTAPAFRANPLRLTLPADWQPASSD
jgi:type 2 lantibiotic biosynthesis protein LanM